MNDMNITSARYSKLIDQQDNDNILVVIDGKEMTVPVQVGNRHYDEIMRQVAAGDLTIADAD